MPIQYCEDVSTDGATKTGAPPLPGPDEVPAFSPRIAWQRLESEVVVLQLSDQQMLGLNPTGSRVWELIDGARTVHDIARLVAGEFGVELGDAQRDVAMFVLDMTARGCLGG